MNLLSSANTLAGTITNGRVTIILPDGTTVIDTGRPAGTNTWANFQAKAVNENLNSRLSPFAAQQFPCGIGIERKLSTVTGFFEHVVSLRVGDHLNSLGTVRLSSH